MFKPVVAIVGRPNVGKSTFFNRCIGARTAIVDDAPGVTRDRLYRDCEWSGYQFLLIDTGGLAPETGEVLSGEVADQVKLAIEESDVIIFIVDGKAGINGQDEDIANLLRRSKKKVLLTVNKIDDPKDNASLGEFYALGLGEPLPISAMRGTGDVGDLLDVIISHFPESAKPETNGEAEEVLDENAPFSMAIVGKPNVGKSSLVNLLCGSKRCIVSDIPGTTRDAIDTTIKHKGRLITLVDTAGIRRKSKVSYGIEAFSVVRALSAISRSDVVVLVLDATQPITDQDQKIASKIYEAGRAVVVVMNKWDLIEEKSSTEMNRFKEEIANELRHIGYAEVIFTSAITKQRVSKIVEAAERALAETKKRIGTGVTNQVINEACALVPAPSSKRGNRLRVYYSTQVSASPPTFVLFANDAKLMPDNYAVYIERKIREAFGFVGTPIRIVVRSKEKER